MEKRGLGDTGKWRLGEKEKRRRGFFRRPKPEPTRWLSGVEATYGDLEKRRNGDREPFITLNS
jgi:hypothetical protein